MASSVNDILFSMHCHLASSCSLLERQWVFVLLLGLGRPKMVEVASALNIGIIKKHILYKPAENRILLS